MNRLLQALGLMRVSEPYPYAVVDQLEADSQLLGKMKRERDEFEAKFKKAITDLAAAREEIAVLKEAEAMLRKRERDRDRRKGKVS